MNFELTILGCGSAIPTVQRGASAQVLNVLERYFLIDCGEGTQRQLRRFKIPYNKINHIFISHLHGDHFFGLPGFLSTLSLQNRKAAMHIYADSRLQQIIELQLKIIRSRLGYPLVFHALNSECDVIFEDKSVIVRTFPLKHRAEAPVNGFFFEERERERHIRREMTDAYNVPVAWMHRLKKGEDYITDEGEVISNERLTKAPTPPRSYAYMTDTLFKKEFANYVQGVDLLYHESTYGNEYAKLAQTTYHSTAEEAAYMAKLAGAKHLILGHFSSRYPDPTPLLLQAKEIFPQTDLCYDGAIFNIPFIKIK